MSPLDLALSLRPARSQYIPHDPTPQQAKFLALDCLEALYGGAAGGGKSDALLMAALQYVHVPGYSALILRRTLQDLALEGAIMDRAKKWLIGTEAVWNEQKKRFTFPSGAVLQFGYCETANDVYRYQGAECQFIAIDELTQWPERPYRYLFSRLRKLVGSVVPLRMRSGSNPGGIGHEWVKRRFLDAGATGTFVPAKLADNPHVDAETYRAALEQLDSHTRRQLEDGEWTNDPSGLVYVRPKTAPAVPCDHYLLGLDFGVTDATAFAVLGWKTHERVVRVVECYSRTGMSPTDAAEEVKRLPYKFDMMVGDVGGLGKAFAQEMRTRHGLPIDAADKHNKRGFIALLNGAIERGEVLVDADRCAQLLAEYAELPWTDDRQKEVEGFDNHCADATLYAWRAAWAFVERPAPERPEDEEFERRRTRIAQHHATAWWQRRTG